MSHRRRSPWSIIAAAAFLGALAGGANAGDTVEKSVIELFTSQGCSSCPPADALLVELAKRDDMVALTLPVDYWDYLGWKDTLASPVHSARQRAYAKQRVDNQVYTPQAVIDGMTHVVGANRADIEQAMVQTRRKLAERRVPLDVSLDGDTFVIKVGAAPEGGKAEAAVVWLALLKSSVLVTIERGENAGRKITYANVVRDLMPVGKWNGEAMTIKLPAYKLVRDDADACAVLLQSDLAGPILAAAKHPAR